MRDLTKEEIDAAPTWATHYFIDPGCDILCYENTDRYVYSVDNHPDEQEIFDNHQGIEKFSKPIINNLTK